MTVTALKGYETMLLVEYLPLGPHTGTTYGMFPSTDLPDTLLIGHPRYEGPVDGCQERVPVPPETHGQSGEMCRSKCRRLYAIGTFHT